MTTGAVDQRQQVLLGEMAGLLLQQVDLVRRQVHHGRQLRVDLQQHQVAEIRDHAAGECIKTLAAAGQVLHQPEGLCGILGDDRPVQLQVQLRPHQPEGLDHSLLVDDAGGSGDDLIQQAQAVAHAALGQRDQQTQTAVVQFDALSRGHVLQPTGQLVPGQQPEIEALAAREDRARDLVGFGRGEEEEDPGRRFLEDLQQRVEGPLGQHVHFVDDEDAAAALAGRVLGHVAQLAHVIHAGVAGRVDFEHVQEVALGDGPAALALAAGVALAVGQAVDGLGQQARHGGLAATAGTGEEIGVTQLALAQSRAQGLGHVGLAHHLVECLGTILARDGLVGHGAPLTGRGPGDSGRRGSTPDSPPRRLLRSGIEAGQAGGAHVEGNVPLLLSSPDGISAPASHRAWPIMLVDPGDRTVGAQLANRAPLKDLVEMSGLEPPTPTLRR